MRFSNASLENNEIDANDNNPLLKTIDPAKAAEEDGQKIADDYEYVDAPEAIDGENQKQEDAYEEGEVLNKITEIDNIVTETAKESDTVQAIATVAAEMYQIIEAHGKLEPVEVIVFNAAMETYMASMPSLNDNVRALPSLESFNTVGLQYSNAQISLEGVLERLDKGMNTIGLNISRLFKNGVGLANSMTPLFTKQISRAQALKSSLNNAHRDAGQKEVSGGFVKALYVDGKAPDAQTVVKTTAYLNMCVKEIFSESANLAATRYIVQAQRNFESSIDLDNIDNPSPWLNFAISLIPGPIGVIGQQIKSSMDHSKVVSQIKIDGKLSPELFKMYPSIAKVNHPDGRNKNLDYRRSNPLFGNNAITVSQYRPQVTQNISYHEVPSIDIINDGRGAKGSVQALNASQQKDVLDGVIAMLTTSREFYKNYAQRNGDVMRAYQKAYDQMWDLKRKQKLKTVVSTKIVLPYFEFYTQLFWRGIFAKQPKIAVLVRKTSSALIDLVAVSSAQAQGGKASQESIDVNPFINTSTKSSSTSTDSTENPFI